MLMKNSPRHYETNKYQKSFRLHILQINRIKEFTERSLYPESDSYEQKKDKQFPDLRGLLYCDIRNIYINGKGEMSEKLGALNQEKNIRKANGELVKANDRKTYECLTSKSSLSSYCVEDHFKTKKHLDNVDKLSSTLDNDKD